ncbi:MAG: hypothetical protein J6G98_02860 [Bacilli bacterium]|nr:hypothetical protein [Bacilli bacterium]
MLEWKKGFIKPNNTKIVTPLKIKSDTEKIEEIKKRLHPNNFTFNSNNCVNHMDRVNNLKKLK